MGNDQKSELARRGIALSWDDRPAPPTWQNCGGDCGDWQTEDSELGKKVFCSNKDKEEKCKGVGCLCALFSSDVNDKKDPWRYRGRAGKKILYSSEFETYICACVKWVGQGPTPD